MWPGLPFVPVPDRPRRGIHLPEGPAQLNREHRAAPLVEGLYLLNGPVPQAVVPGYGAMTVKTGTPVRSAGAVGGFTAYSAISGHVAGTVPAGDISVLLVAMRSITTSTAGQASFVQVAASTCLIAGTRNGWFVALGNGYGANPLKVNAEQYDAAGTQALNGAIFVNGVKESASGGTGTSDLANGVFYAVGVTFPATATGNGGLTIADMVDNYFALTGGVAMVAVFRGILPDDLMCDLTAEPSALLAWGPEPERGLRTWLGRLWAMVRPFIFRR